MITSGFDRRVDIKNICDFLGCSRHMLQKYRKGKYSAAFSKREGRVVLNVKEYFRIIGVEI